MRVRTGALGLAMMMPLAAAIALESGGCGSAAPPSSTGTSTETTGNSAGSAGKGGTGGAGGINTGGEDINFGGNTGTGSFDRDAACVATSQEANLTKKPVDIIFIIDNSGSMGDNIEAVQDNINQNFASIIAASGVDYRVIMITSHGDVGTENVCVQAPLSTTNCSPVPQQPGINPPIFYHYSVDVGSLDSLCLILGTYNGQILDEYNLAPGGWKQWVRKEAFKVFVPITDDGISCQIGGFNITDSDSIPGGTDAANKFDGSLMAFDQAQFGTAANRNYVFHSIIGLAEKFPNTDAYLPGEPIVLGVCPSAVSPGTGYQVLSQITGGLRFPICAYQSFDVVFQEIAKGVIEGAKLNCEMAVPEPPPGETLDLATVVVEYTPGSGAPPVKMKQVANLSVCAPDSFYIEANLIKLCPAACTVVQADDMAKINVLFGCDVEAQ